MRKKEKSKNRRRQLSKEKKRNKRSGKKRVNDRNPVKELFMRPFQIYWKKVQPLLDAHTRNVRQYNEAEYLDGSLGFISWLLENFSSKITKNKDLNVKINIMAVEIMDLARGIVVCQKEQVLASNALNLRTAFEIDATFLFLIGQDKPEVYADRFYRFKDIEAYNGKKYSPFFPTPHDAELERLAESCPEWINKKGEFPKKPHWAATTTVNNFRDLCVFLKMEDEYQYIYSSNSKFTHASPIISNLYQNKMGLGAIVEPWRCLEFALLGMSYCNSFIEKYCDFFGVDYPKEDKHYLDLALLNVFNMINTLHPHLNLELQRIQHMGKKTDRG